MANHAKRLVTSTLTAGSRWFSTAAATATVVNKGNEESLFRKLSALPAADGGVADTLDQWVYEWMEKQKNKMNNADHAVRMDLLSKIKGVTSAEEYFNNLEESSKTVKTYGALLSCYCKEKMIDEATNLFEKMKELSFASALSYNNLMSLYLSIGEPEKVPLLAKEMEEMKIAADKHTYNKLMRGFASLKDYDAAEGVLERMREDKVMPDWITYENLAAIYGDAGFIDKANATLQKWENMGNVGDYRAFHSLINMYARMSDLSGVNRAWESLKSSSPEKPSNASYLVMLSALLKLDDAEGLQKCFSEWESGCSTYDVRICNVIFKSYLKRNMIEEATALYENMGSRGVEPNLDTFDIFTNYYISNGKRDLAFEFFEMGVAKACSEKIKWFPTDGTVSKFLELFDKEKDEEAAEKFRERVKEIERLRL
ncbi:hypothetical protein RHGRI_031936 [Rhododendron griersonianum]|uniref:Pentatricopeptide repeat-containing protein n=1 Tax=Rhododendron griersonianum TaxID=479676 RepID=A0AAV6IDL8_9ERIC|nr:hypothetical protein RHGRI_031936 [Rhododendron griersonianum]